MSKWFKSKVLKVIVAFGVCYLILAVYGAYKHYSTFPHEWDLFLHGGENLYDCRLYLSADKEFYSEGETVHLKLRIVPEQKKQLTFKRKLYQTISLSLKRDRDKYDYSTREEGDTYHFSAEEPLEFDLVGEVYSDGDGRVWVDFKEYGKGEILNGLFPELSSQVIPYRYDPADSEIWDGSNDIQLRFESSVDIKEQLSGDRVRPKVAVEKPHSILHQRIFASYTSSQSKEALDERQETTPRADVCLRASGRSGSKDSPSAQD